MGVAVVPATVTPRADRGRTCRATVARPNCRRRHGKQPKRPSTRRARCGQTAPGARSEARH